jgi:U3 small nucleolar ribonucleoprotein protein IMP3
VLLRDLSVSLSSQNLYTVKGLLLNLIEQGHVRCGTDVVTDPAFLVTRNMEDFVTWVDSSKIKRNILKYRDKLDDFDLL